MLKVRNLFSVVIFSCAHPFHEASNMVSPSAQADPVTQDSGFILDGPGKSFAEMATGHRGVTDFICQVIHRVRRWMCLEELYRSTEQGKSPPPNPLSVKKKVNHRLVTASPMFLADLSDRSLGLEAQHGAHGESCGAVHPP